MRMENGNKISKENGIGFFGDRYKIHESFNLIANLWIPLALFCLLKQLQHPQVIVIIIIVIKTEFQLT